MKKSKGGPARGSRPVRDRARAYVAPRMPAGGPMIGTVNHQGIFTQLGYHSVRVASRDGRTAIGGSGDLHLRFNREQLSHQAREFGRDNGLFQGMIDRAAGYIVGTGFAFQARTADPAWNTAAENWRKRFCESVEISGLLSWSQVEEQLIRELLTMGDTAVLLTDVDDGKIQMIESEQIRGRSLQNMDGLRRDSNGRVTGFWIAPYAAQGHVDFARAVEIEAENVLFGMKGDRPSAKRGVPPLQAAFSMFHRINSICNSEAIARQIQARFAVAITKQNAAQDALNQSTEDETKTGTIGNLADRVSDMDYGIAFFGNPGEEVKGIDRSAPGRDFPETMTMFLRLLGLPLGLPLEVILLDWTKSNYSQSRAVLEQAFQAFARWQALLEQRFYRPLWRWMVDIATSDRSDNGLTPREDQYEHEWIKPTFPWIDQLAEAEAYGAQLDRALVTHAEVLKSKNRDRDEVVSARVAEIKDAIKRSKEIKAETGEDVPWQSLCGLAYSVNEPKADAREQEREEEDPEQEVEPEPEAAVQAAAPAAAPAPEAKPELAHVIADVHERDEKGRAKSFVIRRIFKPAPGETQGRTETETKPLREETR